MEIVIDVLVISLYVFFGIKFLTSYYKNKKVKAKKPPEKSLNTSNTITLNMIRNQYFPSYLEYTDFFINDYMQEAFNIFLKLSPSMISSMTKAERRLVAIKTSINNPLQTEETVRDSINQIDVLLDEFIQVSHQMIEKLEEVIEKPHSEMTQVAISVEAVEAYMSAVNVFEDIINEHRVINREIHYKLMKKYPDLVEPFRVISGKITYLLFINLICYSNKIDENVFILK